MEQAIDQINELFVQYVPNLIGALAILIIGWLIALIISAIVRKGLHRTTLDNRVGAWIAGEKAGDGVHTEQWISSGVFYLIMLFVLVAFFQALGLTLITEPLNQLLNQLFQFAPQLFGAAVLLLGAWVLATVLKRIVTGALSAANLDERLGTPVAATLGEAMYWLVFLLFLPAVLTALALEGLLQPVQGMMDKILRFLPNLVAAGLILGVGWFVARIVQRIVSNLLAAAGLDALGDRIGLGTAAGQTRLSGLVGLIVYILILVPILISALNALELDAITVPASQMLNSILAALPMIFGAGLVLLIAYAVGSIVCALVTNLLTGIGFNSVLPRLGVGREPEAGDKTLSEVVGTLLLAAIMLFAATEAFRLLGFAAVSELFAQFLVFAGQIVMGIIVLAFGLFLANLVSVSVRASNIAQRGFLATVARVAILVLFGSMALRQMGIANEIVELAFGLTLGSLAVALAIAMGLGGREIAARELGHWVESMRSKDS